MSKKLRVVLIITIFFVTATVITFGLLHTFQKEFDQTQWVAQPSMRYEMVDKMIESREFLEKSDREIMKLLGQPDKITDGEKKVWVYNVGHPPSFFEEENEQLLVIFSNNIVEKIALALK